MCGVDHRIRGPQVLTLFPWQTQLEVSGCSHFGLLFKVAFNMLGCACSPIPCVPSRKLQGLPTRLGGPLLLLLSKAVTSSEGSWSKHSCCKPFSEENRPCMRPVEGSPDTLLLPRRVLAGNWKHCPEHRWNPWSRTGSL